MKSIPPIHKVTDHMAGNVYVIEKDDELVLVDTGAPQDYNLLVDRIKSLGRSPVEVGHIIITHFHVDHTGTAAAFKRISRAKVYAHQADVPYIEGTDSISSIKKAGILGRVVSMVPNTAHKLTRVPPVEVDVSLKNGDIVPVLGGLRVIHAPGHTPGSSCFFWGEKGVLFTGDAIINRYLMLSLPTIGFSTDYEQAAQSACRLADLMEEESIWLICTGHGPIVADHAKEKLMKLRGRLMKKSKAL